MKIYINTNSNSFGIYSNFTPSNLPSEWVEISEQSYNEVQEKINDGYSFSFSNGAFTYSKIVHTESDEERMARLRGARTPLLKAFDTYKTNVSYGVIIESEAQHNEVILWYTNILNLDESAISNPPSVIEYYL